MAGYSIRVAETIRGADANLLGVQLGLMCLECDISIAEIAGILGVSRQTVYGWFGGKTHPHPHHQLGIEKWLKVIRHNPA